MNSSVPEDHPFAQYIRILGKGKTGSRALSEDEAYKAFKMVLKGEVEDVQLGAFLMLLRVKEETAEELAGFVRACRESITKPPGELSVTLDWSSYAGKRKQHPWYLLSALLLAQQGTRILMHGSAGHTAGRVYSESILSQLGIAIAENWREVQQQLGEHNFAYMPLVCFCPELERIIKLRPLMGLRSPVHTLSRLLNPLNAAFSIQSVFHPSYSISHHRAATLLGQANAMVFKGEAGEAERRPEAAVDTLLSRGGKVSQYTWPKLLEGRQPTAGKITAEYMQAVWRGRQTDPYAVAAITGTCAFALLLLDEQLDIDQALNLAKDYWLARNTSQL